MNPPHFVSQQLPEKAYFEVEEDVVSPSSAFGWLKAGWQLYKQDWWRYSLFELCIILLLSLASIPPHFVADYPILSVLYIASFLVWPLQFGFFVVGSHIVRKRETGDLAARFDVSDLFRGYCLYFPLLLVIILSEMLIIGGLILFVLPGLYLMGTLSFAPLIYIEYHHHTNPQGSFGIWSSLLHSRKILHDNFGKMVRFYFLCYIVFLLGIFCFGVGILVSLPVIHLAYVFAFRDMFRLHNGKQPDETCYCCC